MSTNKIILPIVIGTVILWCYTLIKSKLLILGQLAWNCPCKHQFSHGNGMSVREQEDVQCVAREMRVGSVYVVGSGQEHSR